MFMSAAIVLFNLNKLWALAQVFIEYRPCSYQKIDIAHKHFLVEAIASFFSSELKLGKHCSLLHRQWAKAMLSDLSWEH